jgi:hypothetical protein
MSRLLRCMPPGIRTLLGGPIRFPASIALRVLSCRPRTRPSKVMIRCLERHYDGVLCSQWHSRFVFYPTFEDLFCLFDPNVSCSPPFFNLGSPTFILGVFLNVEKLVEARILQSGGPPVFRFPYDPFVRLLEAVYCVCPVFFVHRVPHVCCFLRVSFLYFVRGVPRIFCLP